jgi:hypothetical protein
MKLLRYGPNGHEMTGSIDDNGRIHDLSGEVRGISEEVLLSPIAGPVGRAAPECPGRSFR